MSTRDDMLANPSDTMEATVERVAIDPGRTFSEDAMTALGNQMLLWVLTRVQRRWEATNEPPTVMSVTLTVKVG